MVGRVEVEICPKFEHRDLQRYLETCGGSSRLVISRLVAVPRDLRRDLETCGGTWRPAARSRDLRRYTSRLAAKSGDLRQDLMTCGGTSRLAAVYLDPLLMKTTSRRAVVPPDLRRDLETCGGTSRPAAVPWDMRLCLEICGQWRCHTCGESFARKPGLQHHATNTIKK